MCVALPKRTFTLPIAERFHALIEIQAAPTVPHAVRCGHHARASAPARMAYNNSPAPGRRHLPTNDRCCRSLTAYCEAFAEAAARAVLTAVGALAAGV